MWYDSWKSVINVTACMALSVLHVWHNMFCLQSVFFFFGREIQNLSSCWQKISIQVCSRWVYFLSPKYLPFFLPPFFHPSLPTSHHTCYMYIIICILCTDLLKYPQAKLYLRLICWKKHISLPNRQCYTGVIQYIKIGVRLPSLIGQYVLFSCSRHPVTTSWDC